MNVVAGDGNDIDRFELLRWCHPASKQRAIWKHYANLGEADFRRHNWAILCSNVNSF